MRLVWCWWQTGGRGTAVNIKLGEDDDLRHLAKAFWTGIFLGGDGSLRMELDTTNGCTHSNCYFRGHELRLGRTSAIMYEY